MLSLSPSQQFLQINDLLPIINNIQGPSGHSAVAPPESLAFTWFVNTHRTTGKAFALFNPALQREPRSPTLTHAGEFQPALTW